MPWKHLIKLLKAARGLCLWLSFASFSAHIRIRRVASPLARLWAPSVPQPAGLMAGSQLNCNRHILVRLGWECVWQFVTCCDTCAPFGDPFVPHSLVVHCARVACSRFQRVYLVAIYLLLLTSGFKSSLLTGIAGILLCHHVRLLPFDNAISFLGVSKAID